MSETARADAVVIGAGCIGTAIAYHLALRGVRAVVLEKENAPGLGSTGRCAGGVRQQFSTPVNVLLSKLSIEAFVRMNDELDHEGELYWPVGYLFCLTDAARWQAFQAGAQMQRGLGVSVETLTPADVARRWPLLETSDLLGATFCGTDGLADPAGVTAAYFAAAKRRGVRFDFEREVTAVHVHGGKVTGVSTAAGRIDTPVVIDAAGPQAAAVAALAGVELPVVPVRRQIFTTQPLDWVPADFPMVVDMATGVYMHKESGGLLLGLADPAEPPSFDTHIDFDFRDRVFMAALERLPRLEDAAYRAGWGGSYEVTPDHNAIVGPSGVGGFLLANGFSGHGFMHAPAVGMLLADWVADGQPRLDVLELGLERFQGDTALSTEVNVI